MSKLAQLIAHNEGFGIAGAIPTLRNNPGDLKHSPHSSHPPDDPNGIGHIDTIEHGWEDLERQLGLFAAGGLTLLEMVNLYLGFAKDAPLDASIVDGNNRVPYLETICKGLGVDSGCSVKEALALWPAHSG